MPAWVISQEDLEEFKGGGAGAAQNVIYAHRVPANSTPNPESFDRKDGSLILFEIELCKDLGCHEKLAEKTI